MTSSDIRVVINGPRSREITVRKKTLINLFIFNSHTHIHSRYSRHGIREIYGKTNRHIYTPGAGEHDR